MTTLKVYKVLNKEILNQRKLCKYLFQLSHDIIAFVVRIWSIVFIVPDLKK